MAQTTGLPAWPLFASGSESIALTEANGRDDPVGDEALMLSVGKGDEEALRILIDRWKNPLINFFYRSLQSVEEAEDLTQMVYLRIYRSAPKYQPTAKFSTYLFHIARRLLINEYRRRQRKPLQSVDPAELRASTPGRDQLELLEIEEAFNSALQSLPENQRLAILLLKQQELSYREISQIMEATESAVKTWIFRARQHLRKELRNLLSK